MTLKQPQHIAIIMDGNGRWANARGHKRLFGHVRGVKTVKNIVEEASAQNINFLTLYAFSSENWLRPEHEVSILMKILKKFLIKEKDLLIKENIKFNTIGRIDNLPQNVQKLIEENKSLTKDNTGLQLTLALSYGSRDEICSSIKNICNDVINNKIQIDEITPILFQNYLNTSDMPDPDLIIRTSGENRLSNFLLWQAAYSEIYVSNKNWPDFTRIDFIEAIYNYSKRERRFGKTSEQISNPLGINHEQASH